MSMRLIFKDYLRLRSYDTQIILITIIPNTKKKSLIYNNIINLQDFHLLVAILLGANSK